jgi:hypothetical protein
MQFKSSDPIERLRWARFGVAALSLIIPLIFLARLEGVQVMYHEMSTGPREEAADHIAKGHPLEAIAPLREALALNPNAPDMLRQLAMATTSTSPSEARRCFNRLDSLGLTTDEDRAAHATLLANLRDFTGAKAVLSHASKEAAGTPVNQRAWLAIWRESSDFGAACDVLDELAAENQLDIESCLKLAEAAARRLIDEKIQHRTEQQLVKALFVGMNNGKATSVLDFASRIAALPWKNVTSRAQVAQILRNLPGSPAQYRMAAVRFGFPATLGTAERQNLRQAWLDEITWSAGLSAEDKDLVASYLQGQREHGLVAELISTTEALTEQSLYVRRIDSLLQLGYWRDAGAMASLPAAPVLPNSRLLIQALSVLYKPGPQTCMAENMLKDAINECRFQKNSASCFAAGCAALDHQLPLLTSSAFAAALDLSKDRPNLLDAIIENCRNSTFSATQLLVCLDGTETLLDKSVQNQLLYLSLLAGRELVAKTEIIQTRRSAAPEDVYLQFLEAFALHQRGQFVQAAQLLVPLPRFSWHQGEAAVIASILAAAGSVDRSTVLLNQIKTEGLFEEERAMVGPWQLHVASADKSTNKGDNKGSLFLNPNAAIAR